MYNAKGECTACTKDPATGDQLLPAGKSCLPPSIQLTTGCAEFPINSNQIASCLKCKDGYGTVADGCKLSVGNCTSFSTIGAVTYCSACVSTHTLTYKYQCVENLFNLLDGCVTAFNSTSCLECASNKVLIVNTDV